MNSYEETDVYSDWRDGYSIPDDEREQVLKSVKIQKMIGVGIGVIYCSASIKYAAEIAMRYNSYFYLISVFLFGGCGVLSYIKGHRREAALETGDFKWKMDAFRRFSRVGRGRTRVIGKSGDRYHVGSVSYLFKKDGSMIVIDYSCGCGSYFADSLPTAYPGVVGK